MSISCMVCGEKANGRYFGAIVCLPCKSFFIRCSKELRPRVLCMSGSACDVEGSVNRMRCQFCRFQKCLDIGMMRKEKPDIIQPEEGQQLCRVCYDIANGIHFGVVSCEGCKKFFRRALNEFEMYQCRFGLQCLVNPRTRNNCRHCRYRKCVAAGMSRKAIRMGRPKKNVYQNRLLDSMCPNSIMQQYDVMSHDNTDGDTSSNSSAYDIDGRTSPVYGGERTFKIEELWQNNLEISQNIDMDEVNDILTSLGTQIGSIGDALAPLSTSVSPTMATVSRIPAHPLACTGNLNNNHHNYHHQPQNHHSRKPYGC